MKKQLLTFLFALLFLTPATNVNAQNKPNKVKGFSFGLGLEGALPTGLLKDLSDFKYGGGLTLRFSQVIANNLDLTLTSGAIGFIPKNMNSESFNAKTSFFIPLKLGARIMLGQTFYVMGEAGITFTKVYQVSTMQPSDTMPSITQSAITATTFTYAPSIGVHFGNFDFGLRYESLSDFTGGKGSPLSGGFSSKKKSGGFFGLRLGYDF